MHAGRQLKKWTKPRALKIKKDGNQKSNCFKFVFEIIKISVYIHIIILLIELKNVN